MVDNAGCSRDAVVPCRAKQNTLCGDVPLHDLKVSHTVLQREQNRVLSDKSQISAQRGFSCRILDEQDDKILRFLSLAAEADGDTVAGFGAVSCNRMPSRLMRSTATGLTSYSVTS